jgi:hypothetical protein
MYICNNICTYVTTYVGKKNKNLICRLVWLSIKALHHFAVGFICISAQRSSYYWHFPIPCWLRGVLQCVSNPFSNNLKSLTQYLYPVSLLSQGTWQNSTFVVYNKGSLCQGHRFIFLPGCKQKI